MGFYYKPCRSFCIFFAYRYVSGIPRALCTILQRHNHAMPTTSVYRFTAQFGKLGNGVYVSDSSFVRHIGKLKF